MGKRAGRPSPAQEEISALCVELAREGHRVVRLKSGDPMLFGRAGEEIAAGRAAGIEVEVVPGITAAQGAAASLACSLTHRDHARRVQYVTGQDRTGGLPEGLDWRALADPFATTIVYMGRRTFPALARRAIGLGLPPATPLVAIVNATRANEHVRHSSVGELACSDLAGLPEGLTLFLYGDALGASQGQALAAAQRVA